MDNQLQVIIGANQARLNITYAGQNGELRDPIPLDASDADIKRWATEAVQNGDIGAIGAHGDASFVDFVVQRFPPSEERPHNLVMLRPKTPFGGFGYDGEGPGYRDDEKPNGKSPNGKRLHFTNPDPASGGLFDSVKVFSATKHTERMMLGETITRWIADNSGIQIVDKIQTQSSDSEFHCLAITLFYRKA